MAKSFSFLYVQLCSIIHSVDFIIDMTVGLVVVMLHVDYLGWTSVFATWGGLKYDFQIFHIVMKYYLKL